MSFFAPILRASSSSAASTSAACCSLAPFSRRTVVHHARLPTPPKFKQAMHPHGATVSLPTGTEFVFNPAPSERSPAAVETLKPRLSPSGKPLPLAWAKAPGAGALAPRLDGLKDGSEEALRAGQQIKVPMEVRKEMFKLRREDPERWTTGALAQKFNVSRFLVSKYARAPADYTEKVLQDRSRWLEQIPPRKLVTYEARQLRKRGW